jgi:hypothetical protein
VPSLTIASLKTAGYPVVLRSEAVFYGKTNRLCKCEDWPQQLPGTRGNPVCLLFTADYRTLRTYWQSEVASAILWLTLRERARFP